MPVHTGILGAVNGVSTCRGWRINEKADNKAYTASNTKGGTGRKKGNVDWSGSFSQYGYTPARLPGATFTFTGYDGADTASGPAICESADINCGIKDGGYLDSVVNFAGNGALAWAAGSASDLTVPDPPSVIGCKANWNAADIDVTGWKLSLKSGNPTFVTAASLGSVQRAAGNKDASGSLDVAVNTLAGLPRKGDVAELKLYVTAALFWHLKWAIIDSVEPVVEIENNTVVGATLNFSKNGFQAGAAGFIKAPDLSTWWTGA